MDEDNMPMAFPEGYVYSREVKQSMAIISAVPNSFQALEEMAAKNGGIVTCPRTGATCEFSALKKVFIS